LAQGSAVVGGAEKALIVVECFEPSCAVSTVGRRHDISLSLQFGGGSDPLAKLLIRSL
jgi:hypothetical protein